MFGATPCRHPEGLDICTASCRQREKKGGTNKQDVETIRWHPIRGCVSQWACRCRHESNINDKWLLMHSIWYRCPEYTDRHDSNVTQSIHQYRMYRRYELALGTQTPFPFTSCTHFSVLRRCSWCSIFDKPTRRPIGKSC